ncbi:hypothetical protein DV738_g3909, partial [Chaetothyriales sp. CBS 135597]
MADSGVRPRGNNKAANIPPLRQTYDGSINDGKRDSKNNNKTDASTLIAEEDSSFQTTDILRVVLIIICFGFAASYYLTSGKSLLLNYKAPWYTSPRALALWWQGPQYLTLEELALFNGTDPELPIYLAVNGTIFDVTPGSRTYGPGGSYHAFAGKDATRALVTGCFAEDTTSDLRGAEEVYLPIEDLEEEDITKRERKLRAERERREAKKRVLQTVQGWEDFYNKHAKYIEVGKVLDIPAVYEGPAPTLCEQAQQGRPKRSKMKENEAKKAGKDAGKPVP